MKFEHHGLASYLFDLAETIKDKVQNISPNQLKIRLRDKIISVNIELGEKEKKGRLAFTTVIGKGNFYVYINELQTNLILHELKHIDRIVARDYKPDYYYFITNIGTEVAKKYPRLFLKKYDRNKLIDCLYYFTPDEFESQYNDIFYRLKDLITDEMDNVEKQIIIKDFLNKQEVYLCYEFFYNKGEFKFRDFFKTKRGLNIYINVLDTKFKQFKSGENYRDWKNITYDNKNPDKMIQLLEYKINKVLFKGYKKFHRLYTLFLTNDLEVGK